MLSIISGQGNASEYQVRTTTHSVEWVQTKGLTLSCASKDVEKLETHTAGMKVNW